MAHRWTKQQRTVLIAIDDSEFSEYAFQFYKDNVHKPDDNVVLVHVPEYHKIVHAPAFLMDPSAVSELVHEEESRSRDLIEKYREKLQNAQILHTKYQFPVEHSYEENYAIVICFLYLDHVSAPQYCGKIKQLSGKVGEVILNYAVEENADFIIVGSRGVGKMRRTFLGSVSDYCVHHSHVPVMVCRHQPVTDMYHAK